MVLRRAKSLFRFFSCMEFREILGRRARDEQELLEAIEKIPLDSIYILVFGVTGYSVSSVEGTAFWIRQLLNNPDLIRSMGNNARE